jgi:hypothetical protein
MKTTKLLSKHRYCLIVVIGYSVFDLCWFFECLSCWVVGLCWVVFVVWCVYVFLLFVEWCVVIYLTGVIGYYFGCVTMNKIQFGCIGCIGILYHYHSSP